MQLVRLTALLALSQIALHAQQLSDPNIFNPTVGTRATVTANSAYSGFSPSTVDDGVTNGFDFGDYLRTGAGYTTQLDQRMSFTGFVDPTGIGSLRFFDIANYEVGRVATQVTIYYSLSPLTGNSLNIADYTALNGGVAYNLPISTPYTNNNYTGGTSSNGYAYDTLTGLAIPAGTLSILLDFGNDRNHNGGPASDGSDQSNYNVGAGFAEIQAFGGAVPEPSTYALMIGAALLLFGFRRFALR